MKTLHLLRAASLMLASTAVSAKTLEVTVSDIRNDKGNILVMAKVAGAACARAMDRTPRLWLRLFFTPLSLNSPLMQ